MSAFQPHHASVSRRLLVAASVLFLVIAAVASGACTSTAAQPAAPMLPTVTVAEAIGRDITEWD